MASGRVDQRPVDDRRRRLLDRRAAPPPRRGSPPSSGSAERVDDAAEQGVADRHARDLAGAVHDAARRDAGVASPSSTQPITLLAEVDREAAHAALEDQQLVEPRVRQPGHRRDAVADLRDPADALELRLHRQRLACAAGCSSIQSRKSLPRVFIGVSGASISARSAASCAAARRSRRMAVGKCSSTPAISSGIDVEDDGDVAAQLRPQPVAPFVGGRRGAAANGGDRPRSGTPPSSAWRPSRSRSSGARPAMWLLDALEPGFGA